MLVVDAPASSGYRLFSAILNDASKWVVSLDQIEDTELTQADDGSLLYREEPYHGRVGEGLPKGSHYRARSRLPPRSVQDVFDTSHIGSQKLVEGTSVQGVGNGSDYLRVGERRIHPCDLFKTFIGTPWQDCTNGNK